METGGITVSVPSGSTAIVSDTAANLQKLTAAQIAAAGDRLCRNDVDQRERDAERRTGVGARSAGLDDCDPERRYEKGLGHGVSHRRLVGDPDRRALRHRRDKRRGDGHGSDAERSAGGCVRDGQSDADGAERDVEFDFRHCGRRGDADGSGDCGSRQAARDEHCRHQRGV